jgi:hypothetical protein
MQNQVSVFLMAEIKYFYFQRVNYHVSFYLFFFTPFFKPFRFSKLFFTFINPIIAICQIWDGIVSIIPLYKPDELLKITTEVDNETYC